MVAGVAGGLSTRLGIDVTVIRVVIVLATLLSGVGAAAYILAWLLLPVEGGEGNIFARVASDRAGIALAVALVPALVLTLIVTSELRVAYLSTIDWATFVTAAGLILVYRNAEDSERAWLRGVVEPHLRRAGSGSPRKLILRIIGGLLMLGGGLAFLGFGSSGAALRPFAGLLLVVAAFAVLFGPWWLRLAQDLVSERQGRIRAEERADLAARIHDSVLQTLAMIQRDAEHPQKVAALARAQERELRTWLFEGRAPGSGADGQTTLIGGVEQIAREVEAVHGVRVEAVTVGDCALDENLHALLAAAREATVNAAKWSGVTTVSIFAEVETSKVTVYVRDRGAGFDPANVGADRRGVSESIRGRMARHGGTALIRSAPGQGTEVVLALTRR